MPESSAVPPPKCPKCGKKLQRDPAHKGIALCKWCGMMFEFVDQVHTVGYLKGLEAARDCFDKGDATLGVEKLETLVRKAKEQANAE